MEDICHGDTFWDSDLTWHNNSWPQLTECFEDTALIWVPLGYLLVVAPLYVLYLASGNSCSSSRRLTQLFIAKQVLTVVMVAVLVIELGVTAHEASFFNHRILSQASWIIVMVFHILLVNLERRKDLGRFHVLFAFWLFGSIILLWSMYSAIQRETFNTEPFHFSMLTCRYLLSVGLFIVHCFSSHYGQKDKGAVCPYTAASLPSIFLLIWMDPLVIQGFKKPLQLDDLHNLVPDDEASNVLTNFLGIWDKEKKFRKRRKKSIKVPVDDLDPTGIPLQSLTQEDNQAEYDHEDDSTYEQRSFFKALIKSALSSLVSSQVGQLASVAENVFNPFLLGFFIDYIQSQELTWHGYVYTGIILILKTLTITLAYPSGYLISLVAIRLQTTIMGAVLRKSLTVSPESRRKFKTGEIINLMSVDANNVLMMFNYSFWLWMAVVYFVVGIILTINIVGLAVLPGLGCILFIFVMNLFILHKQRIYQNATMKIKDERVKIMNEILNGIKVIKLYGWEETFMKKIKTIREKELKILLKVSILNALFNFAWRGALFWMNFFILVTYVLTDDSHHLDAKTAFMTLSYVNLVRLAVNFLPIIGTEYIKGTTSLQRLNKFMNSQDISASNLERDTSDSMSVRIVNGDFAWTKHDSAILKSIDLEVEPGKLIAVVGTVGAGKSSLLSAMLGEMHRIKGHVNLNSSVAYVPQQAWIQNATVKDNILFGSPFNQTLYNDVIKNCSLESDFKIMAAGDQTEIGEKGINLSGGQKQRISLARALYSQANIYLLDDPLSAVDAHVGKHIFEHAIGPNGCLKGKTRILVTHGVQWLPNVDQIVVMDNGQIRECGTMDELLAENGDFARFLTQYFVQQGDLDDQKVENIDTDITLKRDIFQRLISVASDSDGDSIRYVPCTPQGKQRLTSLSSHEVSSCLDLSSDLLGHYDLRQSIVSRLEVSHEMDGVGNAKKSGKDGDNRLTTDEEAAGGRVSSKLYWHLWKGLGMGYTAVIFIFTIVYHVSFHYGNYWITQWNDDHALSNFTHLPADSTERIDRNTHFIIIFTVIGFIMTFSVLVYSFLTFVRHVTACRKLHEKLLNCVMRAPMSFFDTTPVGRILNRFSQDIQIIDDDLCPYLCDVVDFFLKGIGILITISVTVPWFLAVVLPVLLVILGIQRLFVVNSCQVRRLASNRRSPIYSHFSETLSGASVIRAYRAQTQFIDESNFRINACQRAACAAAGFHRWMYSRLDMVSFLVVGSVSIFAIMLREDLSSGIIGLTISYAFEMAIIFCLGFEFFGMLETHIVSLERVREYSVIPSEAPWTVPDDPVSLGTDSPNQWPCVGSIEFCHYSTRYREGLDLVLSDVSCTINGGEKVGIVGRTGAGKSSMVLSLFRLIEAVSGKILIDGVDISHIGLHTLRHHITILPQDPVLFAGTLRMNLDPQEDKTDGEIWSALEHSHLKTFVQGLTEKLNHNVGEGGENLSLGQRQLLCLARTLLRKTKILILDEATASVDMDTDELIQKTIHTEFEDCTVFTIAHRLNTVMDYDRIMVLDKGEISEFDSPSSLLSNSDSAFYSMAKEAGLVSKEAGLEAKEVELEVKES